MKENWTPIGTMVFCNLKRNDNFEKDRRHVFVICYLSIVVRPRRHQLRRAAIPCTSILSSNDISQSRGTQQKKTTPFNLKTVLLLLGANFELCVVASILASTESLLLRFTSFFFLFLFYKRLRDIAANASQM
jgi:hypothetical protein